MVPAFFRAGLSALSPRGSRARLQIFTYHRIADEPNGIDPTACEFRDQVRWIIETCNLLPLGEAVTRLRKGALPCRAAAITFDDGYENNLSVALPILEQFGAHATIFVSTEPVCTGIMWNDLIIEGLKRAEGDFVFAFGDFEVEVSDKTDLDLHLLSKLKYLPHDVRSEAAMSFYQQCTNDVVPRLMLREEQIANCDSPNIAFGAHTISHPILMNLTEQQCRVEIEESKRILSDWVNAPIDYFAYPNGRYGVDFSNREMNIVRDAGYSAAFSTEWGAARSGSNLFAMPRYTPWEKSEFGFKARILKTNLRR